MPKLVLFASLFTAAFAASCTGDIDGVTTTDFGDAVATTERADNGDIASWLTDIRADVVGELDWRADDGALAGRIGDQAIDVAGAMAMDALSDEELNLLLYKLWEVDRDPPAATACVTNPAVLCCRAEAWSCRARRP